MPHIYIDNKRIETKSGKTIIEAAYENGIEVPHFCWHPELSVAGNCRMCLVEVGMPKRNPDGSFVLDQDNKPEIAFLPKLQIACATQISDGMVVKLNDPKVKEAQEAVMEFLLINHPLDCPICDEAGECKLQEYAFRHSKGESRFDETKNHKDKRVVWGPNVLFDAERCISCSRCIRYSKELAKQDVLTFVQRGDHVTIKLSEGTQLDNPYSMNVIELCPVGALTSPDFRFKSRVWDMSFNPSISFADSTGSNIYIGVRNNEILRIEPRANMYVNRYWLTDDARLNHYKFVNENRISSPQITIDGIKQNTDWKNAITKTADELRKFKHSEIMFVASAKASCEDNYMLLKFAKDIFGTNNIDYNEHIDHSIEEDGFLIVKDKAPNTNGVNEILSLIPNRNAKIKDLPELISNKKIKALFVMEEDFRNLSHIYDYLPKLELLIVLYYNFNKLTDLAHIVLPVSTYAEIEGTYVNKDKRVQHFAPALTTKENLRFMGMKMSRLDKFGAPNDRWNQHELRDCKQSWKILYLLSKHFGLNYHYTKSEDIFKEIVEKIPSFKHMSYDKLDEYFGLVLNKGDKPDPKIWHYQSHNMKPHY